MRLQTKFFLSYSSLVAFAVVSVGAITVLTERQALREEIRQNHESLTLRLAKVAEEATLENALVFFNFTRTLKNERGFESASFVDSQGVVRLHTNPREIESIHPSRGEGRPAGDSAKVVRSVSGSRWEYAAPVSVAGRVVGGAHLVIDESQIAAFLRAASLRNIRRIGGIGLAVLLVSLGAAWAAARATVRPIERVVAGMREISEGRRKPLLFPKRSDELGLMGVELNETIRRLKEVDDMKEEFVAGVTHDLKSPLKAIEAFVARLFDHAGSTPPERQRDYLLIIQNNAERLMDLIDDLLTTARIASGREELDTSVLDLREPLTEVGRLFQPLAQDKKIGLAAHLPETPLRVIGDRAKLGQILNNLVSNAIKFTAEGSVEIRAKLNGSAVDVEVADTGVGIPEEDREKVFEKFFRSRPGAAVAKGTGLGLSIVQGFVRAHGGEVGIRANEPRGTVVWFTLPAAPRSG